MSLCDRCHDPEEDERSICLLRHEKRINEIIGHLVALGQEEKSLERLPQDTMEDFILLLIKEKQAGNIAGRN